MAATVQSTIVWHGIQPWALVVSSSSLGDMQTQVGPVRDMTTLPAIAGRVQKIIQQAEDDCGVALASRPDLCARCVRTLLRAALGSLDDAQAVMNPATPADHVRIDAAWKVIGGSVQKTQAALRTLCTQAASGRVPTVQQTGVMDYYRKSGAPMHVGAVGAWENYKTCACGSPDDDGAEAVMQVGATAGR